MEISEEEAFNELTNCPVINESKEWWEIISKKPIHRNLIHILNGKITDDNEVAKIVASMLTQLIIRKIADPSIDFKILNFDTYLDLLSDYSKTGKINIDQFKRIIKSYKNLGIVKEEDTNAPS